MDADPYFTAARARQLSHYDSISNEEVLKRIKMLCFGEIRSACQNRMLSCYFQVPLYIFGLPSYSLDTMAEQLARLMRDPPFSYRVHSVPGVPGRLLISWAPKRKRRSRPMTPPREQISATLKQAQDVNMYVDRLLRR